MHVRHRPSPACSSHIQRIHPQLSQRVSIAQRPDAPSLLSMREGRPMPLPSEHAGSPLIMPIRRSHRSAHESRLSSSSASFARTLTVLVQLSDRTTESV